MENVNSFRCTNQDRLSESFFHCTVKTRLYRFWSIGRDVDVEMILSLVSPTSKIFAFEFFGSWDLLRHFVATGDWLGILYLFFI